MSNSSNCIDCGVDTCPEPKKRKGRITRTRVGRWEHYMVLPKVWKAAGLAPDDGYMCIGCLEHRIGRRLSPTDFTDAPINDLNAWNTPKLMARIIGLSDAELKTVRAILASK